MVIFIIVQKRYTTGFSEVSEVYNKTYNLNIVFTVLFNKFLTIGNFKTDQDCSYNYN